MKAVAVKAKSQIARPLPVLVPLIQEELAAGDRAGMEHYRHAGEMLLEARDQVAPFKWSKWLAKNFELSRTTAWRYMKAAEGFPQDAEARSRANVSLRSIVEPHRRPSHAQWQPVFEATKNIEVDEFAEARKARAEETQLHRDLALELIDLGYKALATRLHPDVRGGSHNAMRRLNRVRSELKAVAETRRFD